MSFKLNIFDYYLNANTLRNQVKTLIASLLIASCQGEPKNETSVNETQINIEKKRNGEEKFYYPDGTLWSTSTYKDDIRHGKTTSFYENGQLRYMGFYKDGEKSGQWFFYREDGTFEKEINYDTIEKK